MNKKKKRLNFAITMRLLPFPPFLFSRYRYVGLGIGSDVFEIMGEPGEELTRGNFGGEESVPEV